MKIDISHVVELANLSLTEEEKKKLESQLISTLDYVKSLDEVDTKNIAPTSQVTGLENVLREDIAQESLTQDQALSNIKNAYNGFFKVKGIFEDE